MKCGAKSKDPQRLPKAACEELFKLFPQTYNGFNLLAGKALYLAVINSGIYHRWRKRRWDCGIKRKSKGIEK